MTRKLFQEDVYQKECECTVREVLGNGTAENPFLLVLDQTIFFPTGGGQPCDLGTIDGISLTEVFERDGEIYHKLQPATGADALCGENAEKTSGANTEKKWKPGAAVTCRLDWDRRFEHMQRHCGEHILSGIFFRETGGVNRGFHMGDSYMTIDIDVPGIAWEQAQQIETITNEVIWSNVPVTVRYYENRAEAEKLPLRKALAVDEDISIVCVGDESNPADCVACCGTHPSTSGQVGLLKIFKLENYKGMTRVYFNAGKGALADYQNKHRILTELNQRYSSDDNDLLGKIKAQDEKNKDVRQELYLMKNTAIAQAADEILQNAAPAGFVIREYPYLNANDLLSVAKILTEKLGGTGPAKKSGDASTAAVPVRKPLIALVSTRENLVILTSPGSHDCGKIVKDNAQVWNGKGGGNAGSARAMFPKREDLDCFVSYLSKAY